MDPSIRPSTISGTWYPGDGKQLRNAIETYFSKVDIPPVKGEVMALISPHAGYYYSGQVAAYGYKQIVGKTYDVVVVVSPLHRMAAGAYVSTHVSFYQTPLGNIPVAEKLVDRISQKIDLKRISMDNEHSLEIQLPFLQVALKSFSLLPVMIGHGDVYGCTELVEVLVDILKSKKCLLVASSDLHHIDRYDEVVKKDQAVAEALSNFQLEGIQEVLSRPDCSVCGRVPITIIVDVAQKLGANKLVVLRQTNSGDVTGEKSSGEYTVGYLSAVLVRD
ncbi:AmmeMemoRadiSam system protein B [bacterium]|nr:AmmeMemoRadiSam system protein B [bacterium]RQV97432.1 MAG: AmmeMemoRadiSam system protein B [bacterium]